MDKEYTEIYRNESNDFDQIISAHESNMVFKIETIYNTRYDMDKKVSFLDIHEVRAITEYLRRCNL